MKTVLKWCGYALLGVAGAFVIPELPEGVKTVILFVGGGYIAMQIIESSVREALLNAKLNEMRELYEDRETINRMARQIDYLTRVIDGIGRPRI